VFKEQVRIAVAMKHHRMSDRIAKRRPLSTDFAYHPSAADSGKKPTPDLPGKIQSIVIFLKP
jgi:hypothetical protein